MPYNPTTGRWEDDAQSGEATVENRLTGLLSQDNPYMKQAETQGLKMANRRGLLNSSMAVGAVEDSRIKAALPIASQDASQANQRHMQTRDIDSTEGVAAADRTSREALTREGYALERDTQGLDIASRERMQAADNATRQSMQGLDIASQERIAGMNVTAENRARVATVAAGYESAYSSMLATIMNNPEIPADVRQTYMDHAARIRESNLAMLEQLYGIDLQWEEAA